MKRLLLDTNIYGLMVADPEVESVKNLYNQKRDYYLIYGFSLIRKELRATSKTKKQLSMNLRVAMLSLYDSFVGNHILDVDKKKLLDIAGKYYQAYKNLGGHTSQRILLNDYVVVACASLKNMDIVVSQDNATMLSELSQKSYQVVNKIMGFSNPKFMDYIDFKKLLGD